MTVEIHTQDENGEWFVRPYVVDGVIKKQHLVAKFENFTPPTHNPEDCECGAKGDPTKGRLLIANCPCCDGIQGLVWEECKCPEGAHRPKVTLPPNGTKRIRYINTVEPIT